MLYSFLLLEERLVLLALYRSEEGCQRMQLVAPYQH